MLCMGGMGDIRDDGYHHDKHQAGMWRYNTVTFMSIVLSYILENSCIYPCSICIGLAVFNDVMF